MSDAGLERAAPADRPGRHRRSAGSGGSWTPTVDPAGSGGRHRAPDLPTEEIFPTASISGVLPIPASAETEASAGQEPPPAPPALAGPARRTKITLTPAAEESEDVRVYLAPPSDGLSNFDLGNVPASVTPPRSWRKAAWFATMSSCGVAVALVLAGSYLVGQQPHTNAEVDGWSGFYGKPPATHDEGISDRAPSDQTRKPPKTSSVPQQIADVADVSDSSGANRSTGGKSTSDPQAGAPSTSPADDATPEPPEKPEPVPAPRETKRDAFYNFPPDATTMGDRSETFLNEVTENPAAAHAQTGGELHAQGSDALAQRYAEIAYYEVQHIYVDQKNRVTVNTVKVTYQDGTSETQQCTLRFEQGDKITQDCM